MTSLRQKEENAGKRSTARRKGTERLRNGTPEGRKNPGGRGFVKTEACGERKTMDRIRMGVIGIGNMGSAHAMQIHRGRVEGMELTAVCDIDPGRLAWAAAELGEDVKRYAEYHGLLASGDVDAVLIAVPHPLHPVMAQDALRAGLHVLTEKPVGIDIAAAEELNRTAAGCPGVFGIMYNQRTNPLFAELRRRFREGELGELIRFTWTITNWYRTQSYYDSGTWRATWSGEGGGVLMNQCPHNLDIWQWITGMPQRLIAHCRTARFHDIEVEDEAAIYAEYANGATAVFLTSTGEYPGTNRLELSGTRGKAVIENGRLTLELLEEDLRETTAASPECMPHSAVRRLELEQKEPESGHLGILENFSRAVREGTGLLAPGEEGIYGLSLANAAYLSAWRHDWVELPPDGEAYQRELCRRQERSAARGEEKAQSGTATVQRQPRRSRTEAQEEPEGGTAGGQRGEMRIGRTEPAGEYSERWRVRW